MFDFAFHSSHVTVSADPSGSGYSSGGSRRCGATVNSVGLLTTDGFSLKPTDIKINSVSNSVLVLVSPLIFLVVNFFSLFSLNFSFVNVNIIFSQQL